MRWWILLLSASTIYLAMESYRFRRLLSALETKEMARSDCPQPAAPPWAHGIQAQNRGQATTRPSLPKSGLRASLGAEALSMLDTGRQAAKDHLAAFAGETQLTPLQVERARQVARDIADMVAARVTSLDPQKAGETLQDLDVFLREAEDRFRALLDEKQRAAYEAGSFDFAREVLLLDDRQASPIEALLSAELAR